MPQLPRAGRLPAAVLVLLLALGVMLGLAGQAQAGKDPPIARTTITVTDFEERPIQGVVVTLVSKDQKHRFEGKTDKQGKYLLDLPQGVTFDVVCVDGDKTYKFGDREIPYVGGPLTFALALRVQSSASASAGGSGLSVNTASAVTHSTVTVINSMDEPEPDAVVRFKDAETSAVITGRTDSNGQWILDLPRGRTFNIQADKYGVTFDLGTHPIPPVDSFLLNLKLIIDRKVLLSAMQPAPAVGAGAAASAPTTAQASLEAQARVTILTIKVFDANKNPESDAKLTLVAQGTGLTYTGTTDSSGRYILTVPGNTTYTLQVEKYGLAVDAGAYAVPEAEAHEIVATINLAAQYLETYRLENVYFDTDKATLRPESYPPLEELVKVMKDHPTMVIELAGHTDSRGDDAHNLDLSRRRANAVRDYAISKGIDPKRLAAKGYGELQPVATNDTTDGMQQNRRTEVRIITR